MRGNKGKLNNWAINKRRKNKFGNRLIIDKMNSVCFALRSIKTVVPQKTIRMIYFACAHSVMNYGIIFGGELAK
jgi:hypothetical protein